MSTSEVNAFSDRHKPAVIVFCGNPCAGKTHLLEAFSEHTRVPQLEMDYVRKAIAPGPIHDKPRREAAYRVLHHDVAKYISEGRSIAISATYLPPKGRAELALLTQRLNADLFVIQCTCTPVAAAERFLRKREDGHAGADLTANRVAILAQQYTIFDGALTVDTSLDPTNAVCVSRVLAYIGENNPTNPISWARHSYLPELSRSETKPMPLAMSEATLKTAIRYKRWHKLGKRWLLSCICLAAIPFLVKLGPFFHALPIRSLFSRHIIAVLWHWLTPLREWFKNVSSWETRDLAEWGSFAIAAATVGGILAEYKARNQHVNNEAETALRLGSVPEYPLDNIVTPSDLEIFHAYQVRLQSEQQKLMPIPGIPIFFLIPPEKERSFSVEVRKALTRPTSGISDEAAKSGLDWQGFAKARVATRKSNAFLSFNDEVGLRYLGGHFRDKNHFIASGAHSLYTSYVCAEQSLDYWIPGVLPDMRRMFEGRTWDMERGLDLLAIDDASTRYSLRMSVTGLLLTRDGYFVLQRRSDRVAIGIGSLGSMAAGSVDYYDDANWRFRDFALRHRFYKQWLRRWRKKLLEGVHAVPFSWDLQRSIVRECEEETGIRLSGSFPANGAFIGAAFNLRYGRDLNFYSLATTSLSANELSAEHLRRLKTARDKWEVDRLEFLHHSCVNSESIAEGEISRKLSSCGRHLLGALYCYSIYSGV